MSQVQNELAVPQNGAGQTTLQGAYDNDPTGAQILLDGVPNPITIQASVAGEIFSLLDTGSNKLFEVDSDPDLAVFRTGVTIEDAFLNGGASASLEIADTYAQTGAFIGGSILSSGTITTGVSTTWIWALVQESKTYRIGINPAFAAFTLFNALGTINNAGNFNLVQIIWGNNGMIQSRETAGTSTTPTNMSINHAPQLRTTVAGAILTMTTGMTGLLFRPTWSTVAGSTVNFGTCRGLWFQQPAVGLFQPTAGVENVTAMYAVDVAALGFGGNVPKAALRSNIAPASNAYFLLNNGNAQSDHGAGHMYFDDNFGVAFGGVGPSTFDSWLSWNGAGGYHRTFFLANASALRWSNPATNRFLFDNDGGSTTGEYTWNCAKFSLGAQTGAVGNQVGVFVAGARSTSLGGEWADFLLTQAGNLTVNAALGLVAGWSINAPSITLGTGTVSEACALNVAGNPNQGSVGRYGVRILSNPSGATDNYPLYVVNGTSRINGLICGDPGTEASGITVGGTTFDSVLKCSGIGGGDQAQFIMHRHSTSFGSVIVGARSNSDTDSHTLVADGQNLLSMTGVGWDGTDYERAASIRMSVDGTPGNNDMPGRIDFETTPNGSATLSLALRINQAQHCDFQTNQALGGGAGATLGTIGGSGPTGAGQAQWLEIEIGGVTHWVPAWT
jgi:hypothetical protein